MQHVNIHEAKTNLSKLIAAAEAGERVIISRAGVPVIRLMPLNARDKKAPREKTIAEKRRELFGSMKGDLWVSADFDAPLAEHFWLGEDAPK